MECFLEKIDVQSILPLVVAMVLGALIGIEREVHRKIRRSKDMEPQQ